MKVNLPGRDFEQTLLRRGWAQDRQSLQANYRRAPSATRPCHDGRGYGNQSI
jgi:hypothetical protein